MAVDTTFVTDLFAGVGEVTAKRRFGIVGVYAQDVMFALVTDDGQINIKTDAALKEELRALGCEPIRMPMDQGPRAGELIEISYSALPERALDDPEEASAWGRRALAAALAKKKKPKSRKPKAAKPARKSGA